MKRSPRKRSPAHAPDADGQVRHIVRLMLDDRWDGARTVAALVARWGIAECSVQDRASEAARFIRLELDPAEMRARAVKQLERITRLATKTGEYSAAVRAIEVKLRALRLFEPEQPTMPQFAWPSSRAAVAWFEGEEFQAQLRQLRAQAVAEAMQAAAEALPALPHAGGNQGETHAEGNPQHHEEAGQEHGQGHQDGGQGEPADGQGHEPPR